MHHKDRIVAACDCGRRYTRAEWRKLLLIGAMPDGDGGHLEIRQCLCFSTRVGTGEDKEP